MTNILCRLKFFTDVFLTKLFCRLFSVKLLYFLPIFNYIHYPFILPFFSLFARGKHKFYKNKRRVKINEHFLILHVKESGTLEWYKRVKLHVRIQSWRCLQFRFNVMTSFQQYNIFLTSCAVTRRRRRRYEKLWICTQYVWADYSDSPNFSQ